jgi:hypothetical protein
MEMREKRTVREMREKRTQGKRCERSGDESIEERRRRHAVQ